MALIPNCSEPIPLKKAKTFDLVFEGGKPYVTMSFPDGWLKVEINDDQLWHLFSRMAPKLRGR